VLKWYWWRFNGYGYFWGMAFGIFCALYFVLASAHVFALPLSDWSPLQSFPIILAISFVGCIAGTWLSKAEDMEVLKAFYIKTRPWGFWGPVLKAVQAEDSSFKANPDFWRDMFNVVVGIAWQTSLIAMPVYIVIREYDMAEIAVVVVVLTSVILKFTWLDHLKKVYPDTARSPS
jgi:hypothetical protein